jgi:hypothetical protein
MTFCFQDLDGFDGCDCGEDVPAKTPDSIAGSRLKEIQCGAPNSKQARYTMRLPPLLNAPRRRGNDTRRRRFRPTLLWLEDRTVLSPTIFTVTSIGDSPNDPSTPTSGDLRYCINQADSNTSNPDGSLIQFDPSVFSTPQTITLGSGLVLSNTAEQTTITGPSAPLTVWGGRSSTSFSANFVVLSVNASVTGSISGLTIANGYRGGSDTSGGGIYNAGNLTLTGCTITGNFASGDGVRSGQGGGLFNVGTATLTDCTVSGNSASLSGGGVYNGGTATLTDCTVSGNRAGDLGGVGGGLANYGTLILTDCTVSGNSALAFAGGLRNYSGHVTITDCTISGNISGGLVDDKGTTTLTDTIVSGNTGGDIDITSTGSVTGSYNLIGTGSPAELGSGTGNIVGITDPLLAPLADYGGTTQTMPLLPGSPAIDAGSAVSGITTDQRGVARPTSSPDIGAFQSQGFTLTPVAGDTPQQTTDGTAFPNPLALVVTANNPVEPVTGGIVTFTAPSSGASAAFTTGTIGNGGSVSVIAADNSIPGSYLVTASITGVAPVTFSLTNLVSSPVLNYTVDSAGGGLTGSGTSGTLPYVVFLADANANPDTNGCTIGFASSVFSTAQTITLGATLALSETLGPVVIDGPGPSLLTISGGKAVGVFQVDKEVSASISGLSISEGLATLSGGGLKNDGKVTLTNCTIRGNSSEYGRGGGVYNDGTANLYGCTISGNSTSYGGNGLYNNGTATLTGCTISGNTFSGYGIWPGGGVLNQGLRITIANPG